MGLSMYFWMACTVAVFGWAVAFVFALLSWFLLDERDEARRESKAWELDYYAVVCERNEREMQLLRLKNELRGLRKDGASSSS